MNIIAVDDEIPALNELKAAIEETVKDLQLSCFLFSDEALEYASKNIIDVAFLDIEMPEENGLVLAKKLKDIHGATNIIFVTGHKTYLDVAFNIHASGYVLKPVRAEDITEELNNLRYSVISRYDRVYFQCFGSFGVFVNGEPLLFTRPKAKELLAYLIHKRGAVASSAEIAAILWEDRAKNSSTQAQTRKIIAALIKTLKDAGVEDIVTRGWNSIAICTDKVSCDYYEFLEGNIRSVNAYTGNYMEEYSWAEFVVGKLNDEKNK